VRLLLLRTRTARCSTLTFKEATRDREQVSWHSICLPTSLMLAETGEGLFMDLPDSRMDEFSWTLHPEEKRAIPPWDSPCGLQSLTGPLLSGPPS
jgi:hypothetical protein